MKKKQKDLIERGEWDYLIVLDACRYDYFEDIYHDYLYGNLSKVISSGPVTPVWYKNTFTDFYHDIVYISANPNINSFSNYGLDAEKRFAGIIDVWDWGWDNNRKTVLPFKVKEGVKRAHEKFPDYKYIIHYMQPHGPYLSLDLSYKRDKQPITAKDNSQSSSISKMRNLIGIGLRRIFGAQITWKISSLFGFQRSEPIGRAVMEVGVEGLKEAYERNLRFALTEISALLRSIPSFKRVVITSDHGELLGEKGKFGHIDDKEEPILIEVPWLEVGGALAEPKKRFSERRRISSKVRELRVKEKV